MWHCIVMHLHRLHHRLHLLQLFGQLLLDALHRISHMIHRRLHACQCLHLSLLLLQVFLYPYNNIADHVCVVHSRVLNGNIVRLSQLSVRHPKNHGFCTVGMRFHLRIASPKLPVRWSMTRAILITWNWVEDVPIMLVKLRSSSTEDNTVPIGLRGF